MIQFKSETRIVVYSAKFHETRQFYEEILGLTIVSQWNHGAGKLGVIYSIGPADLEILEGPQVLSSEAFYIYIKVENVDGLWEELRQRTAASPLETEPWKHRNFFVRDPNGYKVKFFSIVE